jgi:hypothetical protein
MVQESGTIYICRVTLTSPARDGPQPLCMRTRRHRTVNPLNSRCNSRLSRSILGARGRREKRAGGLVERGTGNGQAQTGSLPLVPFGSHPLSFLSPHTSLLHSISCTKTRLSKHPTRLTLLTRRDHDSRIRTRLQLYSDTRQVGYESWLPTKETEECNTSVSATRTRTCDKNNNNKTKPSVRHNTFSSV